jgi:hypothetical protein
MVGSDPKGPPETVKKNNRNEPRGTNASLSKRKLSYGRHTTQGYLSDARGSASQTAASFFDSKKTSYPQF